MLAGAHARGRKVGAMNRICTLSAVGSVLGVITGCAAIPEGGTDDRAGRASSIACRSMLAFVRAPLDASGLRRAWFLPFGFYDDGSVDFYAPMAAEPSDSASTAFYDRKVGQLTHYLTAPAFAAALSSCLTRHDHARVCQRKPKKHLVVFQRHAHRAID